MLSKEIGVIATLPCGFTEYVISTYDTFDGRTESKSIDCGRLVYGSDGKWRFDSKSHGHFSAAHGESGRALLSRVFPDRKVSDFWAHAFSRSIDC